MLNVRQRDQILGTELRRHAELAVGRERYMEDPGDIVQVFALDDFLPLGIDDRDFRLRRSAVRSHLG